MKLIGFTCTYNEEKMIPYVMPYVERLNYDKFIVYDNMSTDNTVEMLKKYPFVEVRQYDTNGKFDDDYRISLMFKSLGECKGMIQNDEPIWMTWTDFDEVLYVQSAESEQVNLFKVLLWNAQRMGYNVCAPQMVNILSKHFPTLDTDLIHEGNVKCALWGLGKKSSIFYVNKLRDLFTECGFHNSEFIYDEGIKDFSDDINICAFHLKYIDYDYVFNKGLINNQRLNKKDYLGTYVENEEKFKKFTKMLESNSFTMPMYFANKMNNKLNLLSGFKKISKK